MVEAAGTAPASCLVFGLHQQTVIYLYHVDIQMSIRKLSTDTSFFLFKYCTVYLKSFAHRNKTSRFS